MAWPRPAPLPWRSGAHLSVLGRQEELFLHLQIGRRRHEEDLKGALACIANLNKAFERGLSGRPRWESKKHG